MDSTHFRLVALADEHTRPLGSLPRPVPHPLRFNAEVRPPPDGRA